MVVAVEDFRLYGSTPVRRGTLSDAHSPPPRYAQKANMRAARKANQSASNDAAVGEAGRFVGRPAVTAGARRRRRARRRSRAVAPGAARAARVPSAGHEGLVRCRCAGPECRRQHRVVCVVLGLLRRLPERPLRHGLVPLARAVAGPARRQSNRAGAASRPGSAGAQPHHAVAPRDVSAGSPRRDARCRRCRGSGRHARVQPGRRPGRLPGPILPPASRRCTGGARPRARRVRPLTPPPGRRSWHGRRTPGRRPPRRRQG